MPQKTTKPEQPLNFEAAIADLENIVEQMENEELSLEQSLATFEAGIKLTRECQNTLHIAEQKVRTLIKENSKDKLVEFHEEDE